MFTDSSKYHIMNYKMNVYLKLILWHMRPIRRVPDKRHLSICKSIYNVQAHTKLLLKPSNRIVSAGCVNYYSSPVQSKKSRSEPVAAISDLPSKKKLIKGSLKKTSLLKFKCPHCEFMNAEKETVKRHVISVHKVKPFACPHCKEAFTNFKTMNKHIQVTHPSEKRLAEPYEQIPQSDISSLAPKEKQLEKKQIIDNGISSNMISSTPKPVIIGTLITESVKDTNHIAETEVASGDSICGQPSNLTGTQFLKTEMLDNLNSLDPSVPDGQFKDKTDSSISLESSNHLSMEAKVNFNIGK